MSADNNPTLKIIAIINENHENPINTPIKDKIIDNAIAKIEGLIILAKLIASKIELLELTLLLLLSFVKTFVPHS